MPNVVKVQAGYKVQPLSAYPQAARAAGRAGNRLSRRSTRNWSRRTSSSTSTSRCSSRPPAPEEKEIRAKLARIGIGPGKTFDFKDLSLEHKAEIVLGMKEGDDKIDEVPRQPD